MLRQRQHALCTLSRASKAFGDDSPLHCLLCGPVATTLCTTPPAPPELANVERTGSSDNLLAAKPCVSNPALDADTNS